MTGNEEGRAWGLVWLVAWSGLWGWSLGLLYVSSRFEWVGAGWRKVELMWQ